MHNITGARSELHGRCSFCAGQLGQQTGNLTVASSAMASGVQAPLSGTGSDFSASLSGASGQTVASGQTASFALVLTPASGSAGTFTFHCGALPANAACVFNPASETVAANSTGSVTVQVVTGISASAAYTSGVAAWGAVSLACGVVVAASGMGTAAERLPAGPAGDSGDGWHFPVAPARGVARVGRRQPGRAIRIRRPGPTPFPSLSCRME